jgi:hypothetical protein
MFASGEVVALETHVLKPLSEWEKRYKEKNKDVKKAYPMQLVLANLYPMVDLLDVYTFE